MDVIDQNSHLSRRSKWKRDKKWYSTKSVLWTAIFFDIKRFIRVCCLLQSFGKCLQNNEYERNVDDGNRTHFVNKKLCCCVAIIVVALNSIQTNTLHKTVCLFVVHFGWSGRRVFNRAALSNAYTTNVQMHVKIYNDGREYSFSFRSFIFCYLLCVSE